MQKIVFIILIFISTSTVAQEFKRPLTLDEAIKYATEHSPSLNIERMKAEEANITVKENRLQYIPNIHFSGDIRRNLIIPATPVPANVFNPAAEESELMYLKFNTKWNSSAGININYDLFNPEKVNHVSEKEHQLKIQKYNTQITEQNLKEKISIAYAESVIAYEQVHLLSGDTAFYKGLLQNANQLFIKEKISLSEKNDVHRAFNESLTDYLEAEKIAYDRKAELLYLIGMEVSSENIELVSLEEDLQSLLEKMEINTLPVFSSTNLEEAKQQEIVDLAALKVKSASLKYAPTITLNGFYGTNYYNNELDLFNNRYWRGNSYIGISISIPVTQSLNTSKEVSRLRLQKLMESEYLRDIRNNKEKELLSQLSLLQLRKESFELSKENWELSQQNSIAVQKQYEKGYIQQTDLLKENQKIKQSRHMFLQSAYDLFTAIISMNY